MSSSLIVQIREVEKVERHPNADTLDLIHVEGWQCVSKRRDDGSSVYQAGDRVVFFPPDTVMDENLADALGVKQYLAEKTDSTGNRVLVVKYVRLRGEMSFGVIAHTGKWRLPSSLDRVGQDVAAYFKVVKYEPPLRNIGGGKGLKSTPAVPELAGFPQYGGIENARNFKNVFRDGEEVVVTEKLHGTNSRVGIVNGEWVAGSNHRRRRSPLAWTPRVKVERKRGWAELIGAFRNLGESLKGLAQRFRDWRRKRPGVASDDNATYWYPLHVKGVQELLAHLYEKAGKGSSVTLYGEIVGEQVQKLHYGYRGPELGYFAFDIKVNGKFLDHAEFMEALGEFGVDNPPVLYQGPFKPKEIAAVRDGKTLVNRGPNIREGVVVKPAVNRHDPKLGRVVLKYVSDDYLELTRKKPELDEVADA
jgi:RNA ligase (TIGR02306 family)